MAGALHPRGIRTFVLRAGRITPAQQRAIDALAPRFCIDYADAPLALSAAFERDAPKILEIGFGMGETTARIALDHPENDYLAIEVHPPGVGALLRRIEETGIANVRIIRHDAIEVLQHMLTPASLDGAHIFFPDPWPKKRHHKRRLIQPAFVALLAGRMKPGAYLHVATDWQEYAQQILEVLSGEPTFVNTAPGYAPRPDSRPLTKFEHRGLKLGHGVWDVVFRKR
jgi:tRNA (guanine-N7-)-methyltransferase